MSTYLLPYTAGTISLEQGSKIVTGVGTAFAIEVKPGDLLQAPDGHLYAVGAAEITNTEFELMDAYAGETVSGAPYKIHRVSPGWGDVANLNVRVADLIEGVQRGYAMTSLTPIEIGAGEHEFVVNSALPILPGAQLKFTSRANPDTHWILGRVDSFIGQSLTIIAEKWAGEGDTRADWNINIAGDLGPQGKSAYQVAVDNGFVGDEAAWIASLEGSDGLDGDDGWSPVLAVVSDGERRVHQVADWVGGEGTKPATGDYVGAAGLVEDIADAVDIRGPAGEGDGDVKGPASSVAGNIAVFDGTTGKNIDDGGVKVSDITNAIASKLPKDGSEAMTGPLVLTEDEAPGTPDAGKLALYAKTDGKLYTKDDDGTEREVGSGAGREILTGHRTYYVRVDGNDANDGLTNTSGGAFLTIQRAVNECLKLDLNGYDVTIQVGAGTYTSGVDLTKPFVGGKVSIVGNTVTPSSVTISTAGTDCIRAEGSGVSLDVSGLRLQTATGGNCIYVTSQALVRFGSMDFGASAGRHLRASSGGAIATLGSYTISGNAAEHILVQIGGRVEMGGITITLSGTRAWSSSGLNVQTLGQLSMFAVTVSGSATGKRYDVSLNGIINTFGSGPNFWPGDVAGTASSGAHYV